ncbi:DUF1015 family protein [Nocardioides guangzhouensis]|nr:DUF1015 family protein [Nocardioides guangzhouensis]
MTVAAAERGPFPGVVRPFASRVVRQEWADRAVAPMVDALGHGERRAAAPVPASAYEQAPQAFYVYRMRRGATEHVGVVADVRLAAFAGGDVRGHEAVDRHRVEALVDYYADQPARSEPVALLHADRPGAARAVEVTRRGRPVLQFEGTDGLEHTLWRVTGEAQTAELARSLGDGVHYIADGHHRVAARLHAWERAGRPEEGGVLCVLFPMHGLTLSSFHRRVTGPVDVAPLLDAASGHFEVREVPEGGRPGGIGVYVAGRWYDLVPSGDRPDGMAGLDVSVLQSRLLGPALGIPGPGHPRLEVLPDHLPLDQPAARCDEDGGALFVLRPPTLHALTRIADLGEEMPPKTTYFAPKPYAGIFLT